MSHWRVGIVVADEMEFKPFREIAEKAGGERTTRFGCETLRFSLANETVITAVLCGIGKSNAAAATAYLIAEGADAVINSGLSGGLSEVRRGDIVLGTSYVEHDFDLTPLGYPKGVKPDEFWRGEADPDLLRLFRTRFPEAKFGPFVCGDSFVADEALKRDLVEVFGAVACDMESAAAACVCRKAGVPFLAVRRISDDASDEAAEVYREMNDKAEDTLAKIVLDGLSARARISGGE